MSSFWQGRRVFVTGATGIIGSWLAKELLAQGAHVVALIRDADPQSELYRSGDINRISVVNGRLEDFWTLERAINEYEVDTVFHLGAQTLVGVAHRFPLPTFEANIRGTYNLLEVCRLHRDLVQRVVIASSDKAYGEQLESRKQRAESREQRAESRKQSAESRKQSAESSQQHSSLLPAYRSPLTAHCSLLTAHGSQFTAYTEDMPLNGRYPYEVSKSCADLITQAYYYTYGLPVGIARCGNVYGGGDLNWSRIIPGTIRSLLLGKRPIIRSDGAYIRDYIYVKDVVNAYMRLAECLDDEQVKGEAFNFSTENPMTVLEIVKVIQKLMNCEHLEPDIRNCAKGEIRHQHLSAAKARRILKWQPVFDLESGLRQTIAWYKAYLKGES